MLVLLIRGELVRRHPTVAVYATEAASPAVPGTRELLPEFRGLLAPDLLFAGFALGVETARGAGGAPGWFFVLQEQPTEPRFGFDAAPGDEAGPFGGAPGRWRDLSWAQLVADAAAYEALTHVPVDAPALNPGLRGLTLEGATWGRDAAHMAQAALQPPVRIAVHAARLLPPAAAQGETG